MTDDFIIEEREKGGLIYQLVKLDPRDPNKYAVMSGRHVIRSAAGER